ncbi:ABC transporter permease [bacterium]|nr:ABC transporter permease [bacterium]
MMVFNYLKVAIRSLVKHTGYSSINITGLAIGTACCILILLFVNDECSYDQFNEKADKIYRVNSEFIEQGQPKQYSQTSPPIGPAMKEEFPEIEEVVRVTSSYDKVLIKVGENSFYEKRFFYSDPSLFRVFSFSLSDGNAETALADLHSIVLSKSSAQKYFGDTSPVGKTLAIELRGNLIEFKITGVLNDIPYTSHFRPDFIIPFTNLSKGRLEEWWDFGFHTYVLLGPSTTASELEQKFTAFVKTHVPPMENDPMPRLILQPLTDIHLHSDFENQEGQLGPIMYVYLFSVLAFLIIIIACINFMNLATARSQRRLKEIGVRKVVGAGRPQLIGQFLSESILMAAISLVIAIGLVELFIPIFNTLSSKNIAFDYFENIETMLSFLGIALIIGVVAGGYPAIFLSRFAPIEFIKGTFSKGSAGSLFRKILVVSQFTISIGLIFATLIVHSQLEFVREMKQGFDKESVVSIPLTRTIKQFSATLKSELLRNPDIAQATLAFTFPFSDNWWTTGVLPEGITDAANRKRVYTFQTDFDYFKTLGVTFAAGRDFSQDLPTDSSMFIINSTAVKDFGWGSPEEALGKQLAWLGHGQNNPKRGMIIGVVNDFHYKAAREKIAPAVFHIMPSDEYETIVVRLKQNNIKETLNFINKTWTALDPAHPFEYQFLEDEIHRQYESEEKLGTIFGIFSSLAIFIACLGLYGLVAFTTEQRTKEIGIRKVLGATIGSVLSLMTKEISFLVIAANAIAWPLAYWGMSQWLDNFAYRVDIGVVSFLLSAAIALAIALITVSHLTFKAAKANPVDALKYE